METKSLPLPPLSMSTVSFTFLISANLQNKHQTKIALQHEA